MKAYQIAPDRIVNLSVLPYVLLDLNQIELADAWLQQAESLAPNSGTTLRGRANWYLHQNDLEGYAAHMQVAQERLPGFPPVMYAAGLGKMLSGDATGALDLFEKTMRPGAEGRGELSITGFRMYFASWYAAALKEAGRSSESLEVADAAITELQDQHDQGVRYTFLISMQQMFAANFAVRGERERALAALRQSVAEGDRAAGWWRIDPTFVSLHDDVGFIALADEVDADLAEQLARLEERGLLLTPEQALTADL